MKIVLVSAAYPYRGGIAQFNTRLHKELEQQHEVVSVTFSRQYPDLLFPGKTQFVTEADLAEKTLTHRWIDTINPFSYWSTARKIRNINPDVYISRYWMPFFAPALGTIAKRLGKTTKRFAIIDNVIPHEQRFFDKWATRFFLKHHDGFIVMSDQVRNDLLMFRPDARVLQINHPIYDQFGAKVDRNLACGQLNLPRDKKLLLFFGFIRDYKGLDILLETLALLDDSYHLIIAGEVYGSFDKYQQIIDSHSLAQRIHTFNQYIDDQQVSLFFSAADVLMLTYRSATQSGISAIALHFECPTIATPVGGLKEIVLNGENGLLTADLTPKNIAISTKKYFEESLFAPFSEALRNEKIKFSWDHFKTQLIDFVSTEK